MSSSDNNSGLSPEPSDSKALFSALGWIGAFLIFVLIVAIAYLPNRASSAYEKNKEERMTILNTVKAEQANLVSSYGWTNQAEGVVRIPVERAMRLTVEELKAKQSAE